MRLGRNPLTGSNPVPSAFGRRSDLRWTMFVRENQKRDLLTLLIMRHFTQFVFIGLVFAVPAEIWNQIFNLKTGLAGFVATMVIYAVLLAFAYFFSLKIEKIKGMVFYFLFFGMVGLVVEWFILGNAGAAILTQFAMFSFWAGMPLTGKVVSEKNDVPAPLMSLKSSAKKFYYVYLGAIVLASIAFSAMGGFIVFVAGSIALYYFYFRYFRILAHTTEIR